MQWSTEPHGGFSKNDNTVLPVISGGPFGFEHLNVAHQRRDPNSMLNWMERLIRMRKEAPEIGWGECVPLETSDRGVLALRYDWRDNSVLVVHNLNSTPVEVEFSVGLGDHGERLIDIADGGNSEAEGNGRHSLLLDAYAYRWFRVGSLDYLLKRKEV
jgi:maltose alpha-D-glucosyltransferase/alpha-amylase